MKYFYPYPRYYHQNQRFGGVIIPFLGGALLGGLGTYALYKTYPPHFNYPQYPMYQAQPYSQMYPYNNVMPTYYMNNPNSNYGPSYPY